MQLTVITAIFVAIAGVVFAMQNNVSVTVHFLLWRFDSSLAMVLLLAVAVGAIIIALLTTPTTIRRQWLAARQKRRIEELEKEGEFLKDRIAELERNSPGPQSAAEPPRPYVGLKQIVVSRQSSPPGGDKDDDTAR